jgi:single-stranded-DNA-specific exonuclease
MTRLSEETARAAERLRSADRVTVVTHIDADGICAGAVASTALDRLGIVHEVRFLKKLDEPALETLRGEKSLVWFTDLGSGQLHMMHGLDCVVCDHHVPSGLAEPARAQRGDLDGGKQLSGAGATYLVARELDQRNESMAGVAIVGAVGDLQDRDAGRLVGLNRAILDDAVKAGFVRVERDISLFGRETKAVNRMIQFSVDPKFPGLASDEDATLRFLIDAKVRLRDGENWRRWVDLNSGERMRVIKRLEDLLAKHGSTQRITADVYLLAKETTGTALHDAKEFATLLNSCGRYDRGKVGLDVAKGDRGTALAEALGLQQGHRRNLVDCLQVVRDVGISGIDGLQYFDAGDRIMESVVGTVAGMALNSEMARRDLPIFGLARAEDGVKVSARGTKEMVDRGLDLSKVMKLASEQVGGFGGGHNVAAGATIPPGKEGEFLAIAARMVREQMGLGA